MFVSLIDQFKANILKPRIDQRMNEVGQAWVAEASRLAPVDTGFLRSSLGYTYDASTRTLTLHADAKYALFQELGTRRIPAHPFMRPALSVVPRIWRGSVGSALSGVSTNISAPNVAPKYHARILKHAGGRIGGAKLKLGHGKFS